MGTKGERTWVRCGRQLGERRGSYLRSRNERGPAIGITRPRQTGFEVVDIDYFRRHPIGVCLPYVSYPRPAAAFRLGVCGISVGGMEPPPPCGMGIDGKE